ncbi:MAG TPA: hypothetical protein VGR31_08420 [Planctomycetota bacterium]|jgi:hypothetical protein|nr:hypothetical protein [Planctomycetota bacterium]
MAEESGGLVRAISALGVGALIAVATAVFQAAAAGPPGPPAPLPVAVWAADRDAGELCGLDRDLHVSRKVPLVRPFAVRALPDGGAWVLCAAEGKRGGSCRLERVQADGHRALGIDVGPCGGFGRSRGGSALVIGRDRLLRSDGDGGESVVLEARGLSCAADTIDSVLAGTSSGAILRVRTGVRDAPLESRALGRAVIDVAEGPVAGSAWVLLDEGGTTLALLDEDLVVRWAVPTGLHCAHLAPVAGEERVWIADTERASVRRFGPRGALEFDRSDLPFAGLARVVPWEEGGALVVAPGAILRVDHSGRLMPGQGGFDYVADADSP